MEMNNAKQIDIQSLRAVLLSLCYYRADSIAEIDVAIVRIFNLFDIKLEEDIQG